jgi:hypothetical protein
MHPAPEARLYGETALKSFWENRSDCGPPTIGKQTCAGDETCAGPGQEDNRMGHFFGGA